jgi:hypothetical protein
MGEGFDSTCTKEEANKLWDDSTMTVSQVIEMLTVELC